MDPFQPDLCYIKNITDWKEFVTRTPEEYERWMYSVGREAAEFEIVEILSVAKNKMERCDNSETVMENYKKGLALINSQEHYDEYANSGFFTLVRENNKKDTREYVCELLEKHFKLVSLLRKEY